jgi:hypothetical protein
MMLHGVDSRPLRPLFYMYVHAMSHGEVDRTWKSRLRQIRAGSCSMLHCPNYPPLSTTPACGSLVVQDCLGDSTIVIFPVHR